MANKSERVRVELAPPLDMLDAGVMTRASALGTALISDVQSRTGGLQGVAAVALADGVVAGPAFTVQSRAGDNLVVHKALDLIRPGEVLVVAAEGESDRAIVGELMTRYALQRGARALVVDGAVRDVADLMEIGLSVFARGVTHQGPYKTGPGALRVPVAIGATVVADGDLIVGDADGVVRVRRSHIESVLPAAESKDEVEASERKAIEAGNWDRSWLDEAIEEIEVSR